MSRYRDILDALDTNPKRPRVTPASAAELAWVPMPPYVVGAMPPRRPMHTSEVKRRHPADAAPKLPEWWPPEVPLLQRFERGERAGLYIPRYVLDTLDLAMSRHAPALVRALGEIVREGGSILRFKAIGDLGGRAAAIASVLAAIEVENTPVLYLGTPQGT